MPSTLANFTLSAAAAPDDFIVGYDEAVLNGERRWSVSTIANAVSGIIAPSIQTYTSPTGLVAYFATTSAPQNWIECNGATILNSGSTANLYAFLAAAGWPFGGTGKIPDLRGKFIRSNGTDGTYSSGTFGALQTDLLRNHVHSGTTGGQSANHTHEYDRNVSNNDTSGGNNNGCFEVNNTAANAGTNAGTFINSNDHSHSVTVSWPTAWPDTGTPLGGDETRPVNIALLACIKL